MEANLETLLSHQYYQLSDEIVQQIKTAVREAVTETIEAKMEIWRLRQEYEDYMRQMRKQHELQLELERLRKSAEIKREILEERRP